MLRVSNCVSSVASPSAVVPPRTTVLHHQFAAWSVNWGCCHHGTVQRFQVGQ